jgi:hypothetical protein
METAEGCYVASTAYWRVFSSYRVGERFVLFFSEKPVVGYEHEPATRWVSSVTMYDRSKTFEHDDFWQCSPDQA